MLIHHSNQDYNVAASDAAREARSKMEAIIARGQASALALVEHVNTKVPQDALVRGKALGWTLAQRDDGSWGLAAELGTNGRGQAGSSVPWVHKHALGQIAGRANIPERYLAGLLQSENAALRSLAIGALDTHYHRTDLADGRHLCRSVDGELRGFLSDRYRRLDSRPLVDAFAGACQALGAVPVEGVVSDVRLQLKAYLPMVFEPVPNEVMLIGLAWQNSDFGAGTHALSLTVLRLWCTNRATLNEAIKNVHIGRRLDETIEYSDRTYRLDTEATCSALKDTATNLLGPPRVNGVLETVRRANDEKVDWRAVQGRLAKTLSKNELGAARDSFEGPDVINLPPERTLWRASNAISWIAGSADSSDRRLELEQLAGDILARVAA